MTMKNGKATFVTLIIALMLLVINLGMNKLWNPGFIGLTGALAAYGFIRGSFDFRHWLTKERDSAANMSPPSITPPLPASVRPEDRKWFEDLAHDTEDPETTVESIVAEYQAGGTNE